MTVSKLNYGIISTASIAPRFVGAMKKCPTAAVLAVSSRSLEKARSFAAEHDIPLFHDDYHEILDNPDIDAVYIPLINSLHYPFAREALSAGKHVIMEKPFVMNRWQGEELKRLAKERNLFITEAVKTIFLPVHQEIKKIIDSRELGELHFMEFRQSYTSGEYVDGWNKERASGGGVLYGNEAYFFTMAEYYGGEIQSCSGEASYGRHDVEDQMSLALRLSNNSIAVNNVSTNVLFSNGLTMHLSKGKIEVPDYWKARTAQIYQDGRLLRTIEHPCEYELMYELLHYNECILKGLNESPVTPLEKSIKYISLCEQLLTVWEKEKHS